MIILNTDEIISLHSKLVERTGGGDGIRDINLLESAIYSASASFCGSDAYPTIEEKAARLMYSLTNNHAFIDGNKRNPNLLSLVWVLPIISLGMTKYWSG